MSGTLRVGWFADSMEELVPGLGGYPWRLRGVDHRPSRRHGKTSDRGDQRTRLDPDRVPECGVRPRSAPPGAVGPAFPARRFGQRDRGDQPHRSKQIRLIEHRRHRSKRVSELRSTDAIRSGIRATARPAAAVERCRTARVSPTSRGNSALEHLEAEGAGEECPGQNPQSSRTTSPRPLRHDVGDIEPSVQTPSAGALKAAAESQAGPASCPGQKQGPAIEIQLQEPAAA